MSSSWRPRARAPPVNGVPIAANPGAGLAGAKAAGPKRFIDMARRTSTRRWSRCRGSARLRCGLRASRRATLDVAFAGGNSHDWDLAAADLLVHEAGGALTTLDGAGSDLQPPRAGPRRAHRRRARPPRTAASSCAQIGVPNSRERRRNASIDRRTLSMAEAACSPDNCCISSSAAN